MAARCENGGSIAEFSSSSSIRAWEMPWAGGAEGLVGGIEKALGRGHPRVDPFQHDGNAAVMEDPVRLQRSRRPQMGNIAGLHRGEKLPFDPA